MNHDSDSLDHRLLALLHAVRDDHDASARVTLNDLLRNDASARAAMARLLVDEQALIHRLRDDGIVSLLDPAPSGVREKGLLPAHPYPWRPLTAAAAGIVFGMLCTSVVYGFVVQQTGAVKQVSLPVFDAGLEGIKPLDTGLPHNLNEWGVRSATIVPAENGVSPLEGRHMLRMEPILINEEDENLYSNACQVLDLRSMPEDGVSGATEVRVSASFHASPDGMKSRYVIRVVALDEPPETATKDFWSKTENEGVVSLVQRFQLAAGESGWHSFSVKMPLPQSAQSLVIMLSATSPAGAELPAPVSYLDDVRVILFASPETRP